MKPEGIRGVARWVKRVGYVLALIGVGYMVWAYDIESIPENFTHLSPQKMGAGTKVVTAPMRDGLPLGVGSVVVYRGDGKSEAVCYGVIAGLPGEEITFPTEMDSRITLRVGGRDEIVELPANHRIPGGRIPADAYLVLLGDRHFVTTTDFPDSRQLGLIPRSRMTKKILVPLAFL